MNYKLFSLIFAVSLVFPSFAGAANLSVSQSSVSLNVGQTATITVFGAGAQSINILSHSNVNVAAAVMSGSVLTLLAQSAGSSEIRLCTSDLSCVNVNVFVSGTGQGGSLSFSPSTVTMSVGQTSSVLVLNTMGAALYFSSNSNPNIASASLSGNNNTIGVFANSVGSTTLTVCESGGSGRCGSFNVNVNQSQNQVTLSQTSVSYNLGQSTSLNILGGYSSYYVSANTNQSVVSTSVSGSRLDLTASNNNTGTAIVTVCDQTGTGALP